MNMAKARLHQQSESKKLKHNTWMVTGPFVTHDFQPSHKGHRRCDMLRWRLLQASGEDLIPSEKTRLVTSGDDSICSDVKLVTSGA
mmetsp:Transcript_100146/g.146199  ORF Transcript_100146/g.146199 Transcript_100146/m.146199 type:complete len:86 (-) Transcript_100146:24-281(-)